MSSRKRNNYVNKKENQLIILGILMLGITIGYAVLGTNLNINGTTGISNATWDVHWNNVQVKSGSVAIGTGNQAATITQGNNQEVTYSITLNTPGDFYEFTVDAVNSGSIDAMIDTITSTYKIGDGAVTPITSNNLPAYLNYSVTYMDGVTIAQNHELKSNTTEKYKVRVEFKRDIENNQLPGSAQSILFSFGVNYKQADSNATPAVPTSVSFADDSWETINRTILYGNTNNYQVGDTKTVDMGIFGTHTVRIANTSTPADCAVAGFSQTACGFVIEFEDIITTNRMNPYTNGNTNGDGNKGGWEYSEIRSYINNDIYNALPTALKKIIANTSVVSGHGSNDDNNFTTIDKLYLLDSKEIYGTSFTNSDNTAKNYERQLDYYQTNGVTTNECTKAVKKNGSLNGEWALRSADLNSNNYFFDIYSSGDSNNNESTDIIGISPAFRIG